MNEVMQGIGEMDTTLAENYEDDALIWPQRERNFEPREDALKTGLESCGLAADNTATILSRTAKVL